MHIVNSLEVGGLEKFVVDLTCGMENVDHHVACLISKGDFYSRVRGQTSFLDAPPRISLSTFYKVIAIIRNNQINLVHTHNQGPQFYGSIAATVLGVPVVHTKHGQNRTNFARRMYMDKFSSFFTNKIVTVSDDTRNICIKHLKLSSNKVSTILNGVNTDIFRKFQGKREYCGDRPFVLGVVARLSPEKNHMCLLKAFAQLIKQSKNIHLKIVGDGPLRASIEASIYQLNLTKFVHFDGVRHDIAAAMNEFDLFVLPSKTEGISLTLLEAMSCELPVVATAVGGTPEVLRDSKAGILVPSDDPSSLAAAIQSLMNDPLRCLEMGCAGRQRVLDEFSLATVVDKYSQIYGKLLKTCN